MIRARQHFTQKPHGDKLDTNEDQKDREKQQGPTRQTGTKKILLKGPVGRSPPIQAF
jgi:hypothetical protein